MKKSYIEILRVIATLAVVLLHINMTLPANYTDGYSPNDCSTNFVNGRNYYIKKDANHSQLYLI